MAFDPSKFGATPVSTFDPTQFGAKAIVDNHNALKIEPKQGNPIVNTAKAVGNALTSSEQTLGKGLSTVFDRGSQKEVDAESAAKTTQIQALTEALHKQTDPDKRNHLIQALKNLGATPDITTGDLNSGFNLTNKQVLGAAAGTALDVLGAASPTQGSIISDTKALTKGAELSDLAGNSGKLITKAANPVTKMAAEAAGKAGIDVVKPTAKTVAEKVASVIPKSMSAEEKAAQTTWDMIKPELTKTEAAQATREGRLVNKGVLNTVTHIPSTEEAKMVEIAKPYVSKAKNGFEAVANMKQGIETEAKTLRAGLDQSKAIWNQNNLKGAVNAVEKPHMLSGDLEKAFDKTMKVVLDKSKTANKGLSGLLDVRQEFDRVVAKQYPNLYNGSESMNAIKTAIRDTRGAINDLIESKLPNGMTADGIPFKESLKKQSLLYDAIDNVSAKAPKEGSNMLTRAEQAIKKHPIISGVGAYEGIKHLIKPASGL